MPKTDYLDDRQLTSHRSVWMKQVRRGAHAQDSMSKAPVGLLVVLSVSSPKEIALTVLVKYLVL